MKLTHITPTASCAEPCRLLESSEDCWEGSSHTPASTTPSPVHEEPALRSFLNQEQVLCLTVLLQLARYTETLPKKNLKHALHPQRSSINKICLAPSTRVKTPQRSPTTKTARPPRAIKPQTGAIQGSAGVQHIAQPLPGRAPR